LRLIIDLDETVVNFLDPVLEIAENQIGLSLTRDDITEYRLENVGIDKELWLKPGFFSSLKPFLHAIEVLEKLNEKHHIIIATNHQGYDFVYEEKRDWINKWLPFVTEVSYIDGSNGEDKSELFGDLILDDCPEYLYGFKAVTVKMQTNYNTDVKTDYEVINWLEFKDLVESLEIKYEKLDWNLFEKGLFDLTVNNVVQGQSDIPMFKLWDRYKRGERNEKLYHSVLPVVNYCKDNKRG